MRGMATDTIAGKDLGEQRARYSSEQVDDVSGDGDGEQERGWEIRTGSCSY